MTQFPVLTPETEEIVMRFFNTQKEKRVFSEPNKQLMVSLYRLMPESDSRVIEILHQYIVSLPDFFENSHIDMLKAEYPAVVKFCYDHKDYAGVVIRRSGEQFTPQSLIDLCINMSEPKAGSSVFVPYSGEGGFAYHLSDCIIDGFEYDEVSWAISQILLHSQHAIASIKLQNPIGPTGKQYDYIFSFPPMLHGKDSREIVDTFYNLITEHLADNGELYGILPLSFCSIGSGWFNVRKILIDYRGQYGACVVSLPPISGVNLCVFHVKKNHKDIVALMDATGDEFTTMREVAGRKERVLKVQSIIETINVQDEKHVWVGDSLQLTGSVNLLPSRYLISQFISQPKAGEKNITLSDVIQIVPNWKDNAFAKCQELECPLIGMKELNSSYLNCDINRTALVEYSKGVRTQILTSDCILVGFVGGKFKVGRLHGVTPTSPVALRNEVIPIKIFSDYVTEDFLLRCILSESSERQARMLSASVLDKKDLLTIVITVPESKQQQDALCKDDAREGLMDADRKIYEAYDEFRKDMHMKKHAIGQTLFNLNNWWDALMQVREEGNGVVSDNATTGRIRKVPVASIYDSIQKALDQLQQQISKLDRGNGLAVKKIALTEFIEDYISRKQSPLFKFDYVESLHYASQCTPGAEYDEETRKYRVGNTLINEGEPIEYVEFAPEALEIIFDNIVNNACCHGFIDRNNNVIKIELKSEGDNYVVLISNNGAAIHAQIKPEDVFVYGRSSKMGKSCDKNETHFGIGGYEVLKLMREFGGDAEFISDAESEFPVSYKLTFYNTNLKI